MSIDLDLIAAGHACPSCGAEWTDVIDAEPVEDGDDTEGGLTMLHDVDCELLDDIGHATRTISDEKIAGGGDWT